MADNNLKGFRQTYQETGKASSGGGPGDKKLDAGASGSKRANNAVLNGNKMAKESKVGPYNNLRKSSGSLY
jgi:hypothetical protein